jgi:transmembrane protein EpsG
MIIIWITLFLVTLLTVISEYQGNKKKILYTNGQTKTCLKPNKSLYFIVILVLALLSGLRSGIGDTGYYMYSYKSLTIIPNEIYKERDWGFNLFQLLLKKISSHPQFLLLTIAFATITLILITLYKYSRPLSLAIFLFIASGTYVSTMNGARQFLVAAIIFSVLSLILKNKKIKFFILILILSTIHASALIMIPVFFIVRQEAWSKRIFAFIFIMLTLFIGFENFFGVFRNFLGKTQYGDYLQTFGTDAYAGANILRTLVASVPVLLAFLYRKRLNVELPNYNIYVNFSLVNFIFLLFASYNWIFARFSIYFELYNLILLPAIIKYSFKKKSQALIGYIAIICYLIFFHYEMQPYTYVSYFLNIKRELIGPLTKSMY